MRNTSLIGGEWQRRWRASSRFWERLEALLTTRPRDFVWSTLHDADVSQASVVVLLTSLVFFLHRAHRQNLEAFLSPVTFLGQSLLYFGAFLLGWLALAAWCHWLSKPFKRRGPFKPFLTVAGWGTAVFWWVPLFSLLAETSAVSLGWLASLVFYVSAALYVLIIWTGLQLNYGWSRGGAFLLLISPYLPVLLSFVGLLFFVVGPLLWGLVLVRVFF